MWFGRFAFLVPVLAIAGSLAKKTRVEATAGDAADARPAVRGAAGRHGGAGRRAHLRPALALGPIIEHLQLHAIH